MRVDFYQLSRGPVESELPPLARKVLETGQRLLVVSDDAPQLGRIDEGLWAGRDSFLAHGRAGEAHQERQPILLTDRLDPANGAKFAALNYEITRELADAPARPLWNKGDFFGMKYAPPALIADR